MNTVERACAVGLVWLLVCGARATWADGPAPRPVPEVRPEGEGEREGREIREVRPDPPLVFTTPTKPVAYRRRLRATSAPGAGAGPASPLPADKQGGGAPGPAGRDERNQDPPALARLKSVELLSGAATVELDGQRRTLRPGDALEGDVVKAVDEGIIVLDRPATGEASEAVVIVRFDETGRAQVRVIHARVPRATTPTKGDR